MIKISTIPNLKQYLIDTCDFSPILARLLSNKMRLIALESLSIDKAFKQLTEVVEEVIFLLDTRSKKAKELAKTYGYDSPDELSDILNLFLVSTQADELFIEEEFADEDEERKVWSVGEYSLWVNDLHNATHITLFKDKKKIGALSTAGEYKNQDGKWLQISLADIQKSYRGMGLGKKLYQILLQYSSPEYVGIASHLPDRYNMDQVPKIYEKLSGFVEGDYAFIPKQKVNIKESNMSKETDKIKNTKYKGYNILQVSPKAYRLFKNDNLVDQYSGTTKDAKERIDKLTDLKEENNFIKTLRILQEGTKKESDKCPECDTKLSTWTNKNWKKYKKCEKCNYIDNKPLEESVIKEAVSSIHRLLQKGDNVYWEHDPDGIPSDVLDEIDSDTVINTTAIIIKANGDIWISEDEHPMSDSAKWTLYHKADRFAGRSGIEREKSNYEGDDYVSQRLRDRRG